MDGRCLHALLAFLLYTCIHQHPSPAQENRSLCVLVPLLAVMWIPTQSINVTGTRYPADISALCSGTVC